ncbi:MAG TPA: universal stress protein [Dehalococcoidia bacterium]|nr:universal stress protein [Dehalococcoidia bacterium]
MAGLKTLIPLDGTKLSESAYELLPLLKTLGVEDIRLVSVWESAWEESEADGKQQQFGETTEKGRAYLEAYLKQQGEKLAKDGFKVEEEVRVGRASDEVLDACKGVDLALIATHGRTGVARWWLGSVADHVIREAGCPVLVIGPNVSQELAPGVKRILLPLDGSPEAEEALPVATWIAGRTGAELDVVRSLSLTPVAYDPGMGVYSADLIDSMEEAVRSYLAEINTRLQGKKATTTMRVGSPGEMLYQHLEERPADLIVMTSHGRSGVRRAALGSVTDRLLHGPAPVLVIRAGETDGNLAKTARSA